MSNIKINDVFQRVQYSATNGQTQFTIPFPFFANAYVYVWQDGVQLVQGAGAGQYGISGAGSPSGGLITLVTPAALNSVITIEGVMPIDRTSIYSATISNLTGSDLNGDFNREVVMMKQIETTQALLQLQYAPWAVISQDQTVTKDRFIPLLPALGAWRMNAGATAIETFLTPESGSLAPGDATYLLQVADSDLPNAQAMGALTTGFVFNTATTGVQFIRSLAGVTDQTAITNPTGAGGNPTVGFAPNAVIPGVEGMGVPQGTTGDRPGSPSGTEFRFNTDLLVLEYWDGSNWVQVSESDGVLTAAGTLNQILVNGGIAPVDGAVTFALSPTLNLPGTFNIQGTTAVNGIINDDTMATASATNLATALSIKNYVDTIATGFQFVNPVNAASTANFTSTYANGTAGVGATLTATSNGAFTLDGQAGVLNNRYLMKDQSTTFQNGIYTLTVVGDGSTAAVLTRSTDYNQPSEIEPGDLVPILAGTVNANSIWLQTATVTTIGTDPITFTALTPAISNVVTLTGIQTITGAKTFTADTTINNLFLTGAAIQHLADLNNQILFGTDTQSFETGGTSRMDISDTGFRLGAANSRVTTILDEDNMVSDSATALATQQSIKAYADTKISTINVQIFSGSGTYTPTAGMKYCIAEAVAGGGGGGGAASGAGAIYTAAGGGGAGGYARVLYTSAQIGASKVVTIGAAGAAGAAGNNVGGTGGTTTFGATLFTMTGGIGGSGGSTAGNATTAAGGTTTVSSGITLSSASGMPGDAGTGAGTGVYAGTGGNGGSSPFGSGGIGTNSISNAAGGAATGFGAGGGGGADLTGTQAGGIGTAGYLVVTEYI